MEVKLLDRVRGAIRTRHCRRRTEEAYARLAHHQEIHFLWRPSLPDPQDEFVLELAVAANCEAIVTHNVRDFVGAKKFKPQVLTPAAFLARMWKGL